MVSGSSRPPRGAEGTEEEEYVPVSIPRSAQVQMEMYGEAPEVLYGRQEGEDMDELDATMAELLEG